MGTGVPSGGGPRVRLCVCLHLSLNLEFEISSLESEIQLAGDMIAWHSHFEVFRTCHETECATWAG